MGRKICCDKVSVILVKAQAARLPPLMQEPIEPNIYSLYYKNLFPFELIFQWLSYGDNLNFAMREFSVTTSEDFYIRYLSYDSCEEFKNDTIHRNPCRMDIGAIFNSKPKDQKIVMSSNYKPAARELIFDIDLTDYDDVRFCCSGAKVCQHCWILVTIAIAVIHRALVEDFGFKNVIWFFSGRRGVHCWVCDKRARLLSQSARQAIVDYLVLVKGGEHKAKKVTLPHPLPHSIEKCSQPVSDYFEKFYIPHQKQVFEKENLQNLLGLIPGKDCKEELSGLLQQLGGVATVEDVWANIKSTVLKHARGGKYGVGQNTLLELIFQHCYPRLDVNVTKSVSHLLKAPFCAHPKTGLLCVPIDITRLESFDPVRVPTINQVLEEFDQARRVDHPNSLQLHNYEHTSLYSYIRYFQKFISGLAEQK